MFFYKFFQILLYLPLRILYPTRVIGKKNLPKGGAVYICNHRSNADVVVLGISIWRSQYFLAKKELFEKRFLGCFLKKIRVIPIDRQKPELSSIKKCLQVLKDDKVLTIFPQGTRRADEKMELKEGVIMFATKTQKPIVPMLLQKKPKPFVFNTLTIGKPVYLANLFGKKYTNDELLEAEKILLDEYKKLQNNIK